MRGILQIVLVVVVVQLVFIGVGITTGIIGLPTTPIAGELPAFPPGNSPAMGAEFGDQTGATVEVLPANAFNRTLSAAGKIELSTLQEVALKVNGEISHIAVAAGDQVAAGELLLLLDNAELERALGKAEIELETARIELQKLTTAADAAEIALADATLNAAKENFDKVSAGPTAEELAAAQSNVSAAWAKYNELLADPSAAKANEANAVLMKAEIEVAEAQRAYDAVAWLQDIGMTAEAATLQKATIELERAKAAFAEATKPTTQSEIQAALGAAQEAQDKLNQLKRKPLSTDVAEALAKVVEAEAKLAKLQSGPVEADLQSAELKIKRALIDLEEAQSNLQGTRVIAPIDGTVLEIKIKRGDRGQPGTVVATIADTSKLKLTINVSEVDISQIRVDQNAKITLDALRGQSFEGRVDQIAPLSKTDQDVVNYPVTIRLTNAKLDDVRAGMTAVAALEQAQTATDTWLVPTNALDTQDGQTIVRVVRDEIAIPIPIEPGATQGEWTYVRSDALRPGDLVVGSIASFVDQQAEFLVN